MDVKNWARRRKCFRQMRGHKSGTGERKSFDGQMVSDAILDLLRGHVS